MEISYGVAASVVDTLASLAYREIASTYGIESQIEWLKNTVERIKVMLSEADHNRRQNDQSILLWIRDLKQVLYEADDFFDELRTQHLLSQRDAKGLVRDFFSSSNPIALHLKICRIRNIIREKFNDVSERMSKLNLDLAMKHENSNRRETCSFVIKEEIVGREGNKEHIIDLLLNHNSNQNVSLVAIVGVGGLGKTALAQLVYNDADVGTFFDKRMWVCVSQDFDVEALLKKMLELLPEKTEGCQSLESLQRNLGGEKFLIVLDDIWDDFPAKWEELRNFLMYGAKGSKILLTTRNQSVANDIGVKTPCLLEGLNNDESWTLLKRLTCGKDRIMTPNLEDIGRKIAEKCAGVPLAIRTMGSLLRSKSRESDWESILKEGDVWKSCEDNNSIMPSLKLSYDSLAIELKQCFTYCSLYPKDWRYEKDELIDLWMAQGFLENKDDYQCPEDVGEAYVHTLLMKSFLQDVETDEFGEIKCFKMHGLMHDLSLSIASSDYALYVEGTINESRCPIHASFEEYNFDCSLNTLDKSRMRTFLEIKKKHQRNASDLFVFKRLRNLDLSGYKMRDLPTSVGKMSHLRYLNLYGCYELTCLPKSISNLINLQTLRLNWCGNLEFPVDIITKLINLRRLDIQGCKAFEDGMPIGLGGMTSLQSLSHFIVGKERKKAKLNELKELSLRGRLTLQYLGYVRDVEEESEDVNLIAKEKLTSLTLKWGLYLEMKNNDAMQLLENLRPHQNLKALTIEEYPGARLSNWVLSHTNLVELKLSYIKNCQYLEALEGLVSLKTLHIEWMDKLEYIYCEGCSSSTDFFPSLEELKVRQCESLRGWRLRGSTAQNTRDNEWHHPLPPFSRLSYLEIHNCRNLSCMPTFPNLVRHLELLDSSTEPLRDTLNVSLTGPSTSHHINASLSLLKSLHIEGIDIETLPDEWMKNLSSLKHLSIASFSSPEKPFRHMRNLFATLEKFTIGNLDSWYGDEDDKIQCQDLCFLHSLQTIVFTSCDHLRTLPEWICSLQSLRSICIQFCENLELFPEGLRHLTNLQTLLLDGAPLLQKKCERDKGAEWQKIAHIPNILIDLHQI